MLIQIDKSPCSCQCLLCSRYSIWLLTRRSRVWSGNDHWFVLSFFHPQILKIHLRQLRRSLENMPLHKKKYLKKKKPYFFSRFQIVKSYMYTQLSYFWKNFPKVSSIFFKLPRDNHFTICEQFYSPIFIDISSWPVVANEGSADFRTMVIYFKKNYFFFLFLGGGNFWDQVNALFFYFKVHWYCLC